MLAIDSGYIYSNFHQIFFDSPFGKYRPVLGIVFYAAHRAFGTDFQAYVILNVTIQIANTIIFYFISYFLTKSKLFSASGAVLYLCARYSYMQIWLVTGLVEGLAMLIFLLSVLTVVVGVQRRSAGMLWLSAILWAACIFTHERYFVLLLPILVGYFCFYTTVKSLRSRISLIPVVVVGMFLLNVAMKEFFLKSGFLVDTGGAMINFGIAQKAEFLLSALANTFGINFGPRYLSGQNYSDSPVWVQSISFALAALTAFLIAVPIFRIRRAPADERRAFLFVSLGFFLAFASLLLSASISFRQEFRWIYAPYVIVSLWALYSARQGFSKSVGNLLVTIFFLLTITSDVFYAKKIKENIYFMAWMHKIRTDVETHTDAAPAIIDFGPREVVAGEAFNAQPSGENAVWLKVNGRAICGKVFVDDTPIESACSEPVSGVSNVSFGMPKKFTAGAGIHTITFIDSEGRGWLPVIFKVKEPAIQ